MLPTNDGAVHLNLEPASLTDRVTVTNLALEIDTTQHRSRSNWSPISSQTSISGAKRGRVDGVALSLVAASNAIAQNGLTTQAIGVDLKEQRAYVSCNMAADLCAGAIQVVSVQKTKDWLGPLTFERLVSTNWISYRFDWLFVADRWLGWNEIFFHDSALTMTNEILTRSSDFA